MKQILLFSLMALGLQALHGQNLVPNPGFEEMRRCPKSLGQLEQAIGWTNPNGGSPDYFNACYERDIETAGVPNNFFGTRTAYEGQGYVGLLNGVEEKEYLQVALVTPLVGGRTYCLRYRAATPRSDIDARNLLRCYFLDAPHSQKDWGPIGLDTTVAVKGAWMAVSEGQGWSMYGGSYTAAGGEQYLLIGHSNSSQRSYSFIDQVEVIENMSGMPCHLDELAIVDPDSNNLVPNPGFERMHACPTQREDLALASGWHVAENSPDFYHACGSGTAAVPNNELGEQEPHSGNGYGGIWAMLLERNVYREFVQTRLKRPLEAGRKYCLSIWVSLAEDSDHALDELQLRVARPEERTRCQAGVDTTELVTLRNGSLLSDMDGWTFLHGTFVARGGEQMIMIGNFRGNEDPHMHQILEVARKGEVYSNCAYYYIDDLGLHRVGDPKCACPADVVHLPEPDPTPKLPNYAVGDTLVLRNLQFAHNSYELLPASFPQLDSLADYLKGHSELRIRIAGHTDSDGEDAYNLKLSANRAASVASYLLQVGLAQDRLASKGMGEQAPCASNASEEGKALNRRVEVTFW